MERSHTYATTIAATAQPKAMKNPYPTSCPDLATDFLQTALSDLLRAVSFYYLLLSARSSSDRVPHVFRTLAEKTLRLEDLNECIGLKS
jgi:hypothetical protein